MRKIKVEGKIRFSREHKQGEKKMKKWVYSLLSGIVILGIVFGAVVNANSVKVNASQQIISISLQKASAYPLNWYEDSQLHNGLWYEDINNPIYVQATPQSPIYQVSFMKIYSLGGTLRVMEISTYPRAYKNTRDVYLADTPFVVAEADLNHVYGSIEEEFPRPEILVGTWVFRDTRSHNWLIGETATHYTGDALPDNSPLWVESEILPTPKWVDNKNTVLPMVFSAIKGELVSTALYEGAYRQSDELGWGVIPQQMFDTLKSVFTSSTTEIRVNKITRNKDRTIVRIIYDRVIR